MLQTFDDGPSMLDSGDQLRIVVFGQDVLSNKYSVDAQGQVTLPLIGALDARGMATSELGGDPTRTELSQRSPLQSGDTIEVSERWF